MLTSNNSSLSEIAADGAALLLDDPTDLNEIKEGLTRLVDDNSLYSDLIVQGAERAELFTPEICAQATIKIFQSILKR